MFGSVPERFVTDYFKWMAENDWTMEKEEAARRKRTITLRTGSGQVKSTIEVQGRISQYRTSSGKQVQAARGVDGQAYICVHGRWRPTNMQFKAGV